jgi:hypothetical protein
MAASRSRPAVVAVLGAALLGVAVYVLATVGFRTVMASEVSAATLPGSVPDFVHNPPDTVPTTEAYGPVGPVSLVFAGEGVRTGLTGTMENPWIAVSSQNGQYRALSAPHRPAPSHDVVAVSADGRLIAWGHADGLLLYDPVEDTSREAAPGLRADPLVVDFSPNGRHLAAYDGSVRIIEVRTGEILATLTGVDDKAARQAVWTPDGSALTYVRDGRLVVHAWRSDTQVSSPTSIPGNATLAWQPSGNQLAALVEERGVRSVEVFDVLGGARLRAATSVSRDRYSIQDLLGFTKDDQVVVTALTSSSGPLPLAFAMSTVDGGTPPKQVMQLSDGGRWSTLEVAAEPLSFGSTSFEDPDWPASDLAKLVASAVVAVFALGLYLTRRPGHKAKA